MFYCIGVAADAAALEDLDARAGELGGWMRPRGGPNGGWMEDETHLGGGSELEPI